MHRALPAAGGAAARQGEGAEGRVRRAVGRDAAAAACVPDLPPPPPPPPPLPTVPTRSGLPSAQPNTCIVAALTYIDRSVKDGRFALSLQNWQPCLLAAFVVAAKLAFDEPVWNEDFVKALRISNVQVTQISKWEADFLQLIGYQTNVGLSTYAALCFQLQQRHEILHDSHAHFFTYLMAQPRAESPAPS